MVLTTVYAVIFGFFYSRNVWYIFSLLKDRITNLQKIILFSLILIVPIWLINSYRMWTAFHIFMYGLLPFIFENKKEKLIFVYLSILVHFSYIMPVSLILIYQILGNRIKIYFSIFIISLFISDLDLNSITKIVDQIVPQRVLERSSSYIDEDVIAIRIEKTEAKNLNWYVTLHHKVLKWALWIVLIFFYLKGNNIIKYNHLWKRLFSLTLLFYSFANILSTIPSGSRFILHAFFLTLIMSVLYLEEFPNDLNFNRLIKILSPAFFLFIIITIRLGLYSTSITSVIGNPFIAFLNVGETMSINDLIK